MALKKSTKWSMLMGGLIMFGFIGTLLGNGDDEKALKLGDGIPKISLKASDGKTYLLPEIAEKVSLTTVHRSADESAQRRCAANVAVCMCRAEAKIEICWHDRKRTVEMLLSTPILVPIENHRCPTATVEDPLVGPPAAADHGVRFEIEQNGVLVGPSSHAWIFSVFHGVDDFFYGYLSAA